MQTILVIATLLGGIAAVWFFWDKLVIFFKGGESVSEHDIKLYKEYKKLFVENGVAEFYRQHDFSGSFQENYWSPLSQYVDTWGTIEHEFVNKTLNSLHKKAYSSAVRLGMKIAQYTFPIGQNGYLRSVKHDNLPVGPTPDYIKRQAQEINSLKPAFIKAHNKFVKVANAKLYNKIA